jgi:hypothetical protein
VGRRPSVFTLAALLATVVPQLDYLTRSRSDLVDLDETSTTRMVRLHSDTAP